MLQIWHSPKYTSGYNKSVINPFHATDLFLSQPPQNIKPEIFLCFQGGYKIRTVGWNGLKLPFELFCSWEE